jgi:hypothetical protein
VKVFWAWQADLPGKISRHVIREALEEAIEQLRQPRDIEEPDAESRRGDLHLDHDTKGLKGSPEIAHEIFNKISAATVVVADVTPVGRGPDRPDKDGKPLKPKPLMNPNVAIELGYAYGKLSTESFLAVLNEAYGDVDSLPFDIIHRRHPIVYNLKEGATKTEIEREKKKLIQQFANALKPYLTGATTVSQAPSFNEAQPKIGKAFYFSDGERLARLEHPNVDFIMPFRTVFYMRVIPRTPLNGNLAIQTLAQSVSRYGQFRAPPTGASTLQNKYGVIVLSPAGNTHNIDDLVQYFRTGEVWCINADILREGERGRYRYVFTQPLEETLIAALWSIMRFHAEVTSIAPPFYVEVGSVGVAGRTIAHGGVALNSASPVLASDEITHSAVLNRIDEQALISFLMAFFEKLNNDSGVPRPKGLYGR